MIFDTPDKSIALSQGDILNDCPILSWDLSSAGSPPQSINSEVQIVVLTQACDLAQTKTKRVLVAVVHRVQYLVAEGLLQSKTIRDQVRVHRVYGWYFLPAGKGVEESIVDLPEPYPSAPND